MQYTSPSAGMPVAKKQGISPALRGQLVLIILPLVLVLLMGAGIAGLQTTSLKGVQLGYPTPKVLILSPGSGTISAPVNQAVNFSADSPGRDLLYTWDFGDGNSSTGADVSHTYQQIDENNGFIYTVSVTVHDVLGRTSTASTNVKVLPAPPAANFSYNQPYGAGYYYVTFDASSSTVGTQNATYNWSFGDGSTDQQTSPTDSYNYNAPGTYSVTLSITDDLGQTGTYTMDVVVQ